MFLRGYETLARHSGDVLKRSFDLIGASLGLLLLSPVLGLTAAAVWLDSGWPVFYRGVRAGRWAFLFECSSSGPW